MCTARTWLGLALIFGLSNANAVIIDFTDDGTFQAPSVSEGGVTVTGSANVNVFNFNGLGVVGGVNDTTTDIGEFLEFVADGPSEFGFFEVGKGFMKNVDGGPIDSFTAEGFDSSGTSLGTFNLAGSGLSFFSVDWVAQLGVAFVDRLRIFATPDEYRIGSIDVNIVSNAVPEPPTILLAAIALMGFARRRSSRRIRTDT